MSKDPKPAANTGKTTPKPPKPSIEGTEADLWDIDSGTSESEVTETPSPESIETLPEPRERTSNLRSRKPTKRETEVPTVVRNETPAETEPKDTARPIAEAKPESIPEAKDDKQAEEEADIPEPGSSAASLAPPSFTKTERIAVAALFGILLLAGGMAISHFSNRVPTRPIIAEKPDFPIRGKLVEIQSASTYWRKPVTTGDQPDTVRRGTAFIPILQLKIKAKPCTIRAFFRDQEGIVIGDIINRSVSGEQELTLPATAGFDDIGMHAAYRTGEQLPWTVHILEGPSSGGELKDFKEILKTQISSDVR